jgi:hypothetical protein
LKFYHEGEEGARRKDMIRNQALRVPLCAFVVNIPHSWFSLIRLFSSIKVLARSPLFEQVFCGFGVLGYFVDGGKKISGGMDAACYIILFSLIFS